MPSIASEGGGQGLTLLAAFQDLSQARTRWGEAAEGFLTLFGTKLILPGIADPRTLESVSTALGEYDRQVVARTRSRGSGLGGAVAELALGASRSAPRPQRSTTVSTQRTRVLSAGEVANVPAGRGLHLDGLAWELLTLTPAHRTEPWKTLIAPPAEGRWASIDRAVVGGRPGTRRMCWTARPSPSRSTVRPCAPARSRRQVGTSAGILPSALSVRGA